MSPGARGVLRSQFIASGSSCGCCGWRWRVYCRCSILISAIQVTAKAAVERNSRTTTLTEEKMRTVVSYCNFNENLAETDVRGYHGDETEEWSLTLPMEVPKSLTTVEDLKDDGRTDNEGKRKR